MRAQKSRRQRLAFVRGPHHLKLELLLIPATLVLHIERRISGNTQSLARHLNRKGTFRLNGIGKPTELGDKLGAVVRLREITI
jgi:hypothetical protein